jgi:isoquinoline 1-oxidoreductase alpha subunit
LTTFHLDLNGESVSIDAPDDAPLLWVLRDRLDLRGTKFGCGKGICGSCTVLVDDRARRSCVTRMSNLEGRRITTIEGLSSDGDHPLQRAWIAEQVPQCGYCQPGQIMNAAALLRRNPRPDEGEIDAAMDRVLCRCGTYLRIRRAIERCVEGM